MNFAAKDLVSIIKAMEKSRVTSLEYEGLKIECGENAPFELQRELQRETFDAEPYRTNPAPEQDVDPYGKTSLEQAIESDPDIRDMELQNLMITNPLAFEAAMDREDIDDATQHLRIKQSVPTG